MNPPSTVVTVITAVPEATAVTLPLLSTVATAGSLLLQVTFLLEGVVGVKVGIKVPVLPADSVMADFGRLMPSTGAGTLTVQVAVNPPSTVRTVITAVPPPTAVILPVASTVATDVLLELHVTALLFASAGLMVAKIVPLVPGCKVMLDLLSVTPVAGCRTVTVQEAVLPPSAVLAVITVVPPVSAVTLPVASTVATAGLLEVQVTALFDAVAGSIVGIKMPVLE